MTSRARIALLVSGIVLLLAMAAGVLLRSAATPEAEVTRAFEAMIRQFEERESEALLRTVRDPVRIALGAEVRDESHGEVVARLEGVYRNLTYIAIRPQDIAVTLDGAREATVRCEFHWSISTSLYPNARITSERENPGGAPDVAIVSMERENSTWFVTSVALELH